MPFRESGPRHDDFPSSGLLIVASNSSSRRFFIGLFPDLAGMGGVQESGRLTAAAIQETAQQRGWTAQFLSLNGAPGNHSLVFGAGSIPFRGFDRGKMRFALSALQSARRFSSEGRTVLLAAHPNLAPIAAWMRRVSPNVKTIVVGHGIDVWAPLSARRRRALAASDLVLSPSRFTAQKIVEVQGVPGEKVRRLPWPLSPSFLALAESPDKLRLPGGFPEGRVVLTVGRWMANERYKGFDELIGAIPHLLRDFPNIQLVALGSGDDLPRLRKLASDSGVGDRVQFLQGLSREQIAACYAAAEIFALPSTGEGFGLVFLEAMAFAKPVLGAAAGGVSDVIDDGTNGLLVPPSDADALRGALEKLLADARLRAELGQNGARKVRETYAFDVFQRDLEGIVSALFAGEATPPKAAPQP